MLIRSFITLFVALGSICGNSNVTRAVDPDQHEPERLVAPFDEKTTKESQAAWAKKLGQKEIVTNSIGMKMTLIPPGKFTTGSPENEKFRDPNEKRHKVNITKPFYLSVYVVTRGEFTKFVTAENFKTEGEKDGEGSWGWDETFGRFDAEKDTKYGWRDTGFVQTDKHPVVNVSWNDATAFCSWLSKKEGKHYRLPREAEWEYACRAGTQSAFHFGDSLNGKEANCKGNYPYGTAEEGPFLRRTSAVGSYKPNAFGLYDMHGNVRQWCSDWYDEHEEYEKLPADDPAGPTTGEDRVMRCGGWWDLAEYCRAAVRGGKGPAFHAGFLGFRVVCEP